MRYLAIVGAGLLVGLLGCGGDDAPAAATVTAVIGVAGGTVELAGGGKVTIPPNALTENVSIKITKLDLDDVADLPSNMEPAGKPYAFEPHGQTFAQNVKIELPFDGEAAEVRPMKLPNETADTDEWTTVFPSEKNEPQKKLSMDTRSFSVLLAARPRRSSGVITLPDGAIADDAGTDAMVMNDAGTDAMVVDDAGMDATVMNDADVDAGPASDIAYLKASNPDQRDSFGNRIALDGDTLVVSAYSEDSNAAGINGNQADNSAAYAGAVYVFVRSGGVWTQQAYLKASNTENNDSFGDSVAVSGDTIVVGASSEDSAATGVNGNQADNTLTGSGAAYVFVRSGTTWTQQAYLKPSTTRQGMAFGLSVAIGGDTIVVGATGESSNATTINGDETNTSAPGAGAAYVFKRSGTVWTQNAYLKASNAEAQDNFGISVAVSDDGLDLVVGADREDSNATGVDGDGTNNSAMNSGAAYLFRDVGYWQQAAYFKANNPGMNHAFGYSVAIDGVTVVVGAPAEDSNATATDGDPFNALADSSGAVFVFGNDEGTWRTVAYLKASNTGVGDEFGRSVAIAGDRLVIGASNERSSAIGINGDQLNDDAAASGAAYVFAGVPGGTYYPFTTWQQQAYLKASNTDETDYFGVAVAVSADAIVVGASGEESNATGVGGNPTDNSLSDSGAVYVFDPIVPVFRESCTGGVDDDGDGDTDCEDSDCASSFECISGCLAPTTYTPLDAMSEGVVSSGLVLWLRGDVGVALDGNGRVCSWEDQSGTRHHVAQSSGARPMPGAALGGQASIDFALGEVLYRDDVLSIAPTSGRTFFAVVEVQDAAGRAALVQQGQVGTSGTYVALDYNTYNTVGQRFGCYATNNAYDADLTLDTLAHIHGFVIATMVPSTSVLPNIELRIDGTARALTRTSGGAGTNVFEAFDSANRTWIGQGDLKLAEVLIYDRALPPNELTTVESYLAARYGVQLP